jgi:hypothetical protein
MGLKTELQPKMPRASMSMQPVPIPPSGTPQHGGEPVRKTSPQAGLLKPCAGNARHCRSGKPVGKSVADAAVMGRA